MQLLQFMQGFSKIGQLGRVLLCVLVIFCVSAGSTGAKASPSRHILFLHSHTEEFPAHKMFESGFKKQLQMAGETDVEYSYDYLELTKFSSNPDFPEQLASFMKLKYVTRQPDVVVTHLGPAKDFALKYGRDIFPGAQFMLAVDEVEGVSNSPLPPGYGGVTGIFDVKNTIGLILQLQPEIRKIYVVIGDSERERQTLILFRKEVEPLFEKVEFAYLNNLPLPQMVETVRNIREKAAVMYVFVFKDVAGNVFIPANEVKTFSMAASVPVYIPYAAFMGRGAIGGHLMSTEVLGMKAASLSLAQLKGQGAPSSSVMVEDSEYQFDWRALKRWGIDESRLPAGSKVLFKELTVWEQYRGYIIAGAVLIGFLSFLVIALLINRAQRLKAEQELTRLNADLESKVDERTLALSKTNAELEKEIVERRRAEKSLQRSSEIQTVLKEIAEAAVLAPSLEQLYKTVQRLVERVLPAHLFQINLFDEESGEIMIPFRASGMDSIPDRRPAGEGMTEYVMRLGRAVYVTPVEMDRLRETGEYALTHMPEPPIRHFLGAPLVDSNGTIFGVMSLMTLEEEQTIEPDIETLSIIAAQVAMAIERKQTESELALMYQKSEGASRAKSSFLANMSHELRTPLNAIIGFSEVLQDKLFGSLNTKQEKYVENILVSAEHLLCLVTDVLDMSKIEAGKMELERSRTDIEEICQNTVALFGDKAARRKVKLNFIPDASIAGLTMIADARRIKQILYNLVDNGIKYNKLGGSVCVTVEKVNGEASPSAIRIVVEDTGIGITSENLDLLFRPFGQVSRTPTELTEGTGLGLAITKRLVELHRGEILAESEFGKGSRFIVWIPLQEE